MYLDRYHGDHTGTLKEVSHLSTVFNNFIKLTIIFDDGYNNKPDYYPNEILIQDDKVLGERLERLDLHRFEQKRIRLVRDEALFRITIFEEDDSEGFSAIISELDECNQEDDEIFALYDSGYDFERLAETFARSISSIRLKINQIETRKFSSPRQPKGISSFITIPQSYGKFIFGADTKGMPEDIYCNSDNEQSSSTGFSPFIRLFELFNGVDDLPEKEIDFAYDQVNCTEEYSKDISYPTKMREIIHNSLITNGSYFNELLKRLNSQKRIYFWLSLEDFGLGGKFNSYYFYATDDIDVFIKLKDQSPQFLKYIIFTKSQNENGLNKIISGKTIEARNQSVRAALASIMARNMSHNLGSHFLFYTKSDIEDWANCLVEYSQQDLTQLTDLEIHFNSILETIGYTAPYIRGASKVIGYIKERMNHLSTVISDDKVPYMPVNLKTQILDELLIDDATRRLYPEKEKSNKRTVNYYLQNLVRSEGYVRPDILSDLNSNQSNLLVRILFWDEISGIYISVDDDSTIIKEISKLTLALPGGTLAIHAFFNIIENFIRNSAKYNWAESKPNLTISIAIKPLLDEEVVEFLVFDNKEDANVNKDGVTLFEYLKNCLLKLRFLNDDNTSINTDNKGVKEILLSSLWLNTNEMDSSLSNAILDYISLDAEGRIRKLTKYGFIYKRVNYDGIDVDNNDDVANIAIKFALPLFFPVKDFLAEDNIKLTDITRFRSDLVRINNAANISLLPRHPSLIFPRMVWTEEIAHCLDTTFVEETSQTKEYNEACAFFASAQKRFPEFEKYKLFIGSAGREPNSRDVPPGYTIEYSNHMNVKVSIDKFVDYWNNYPYVDSISGENYTKLLEEMVRAGLSGSRANDRKFKKWEDKYLCMKIVESALTRITIIDERICKSIKWVKFPTESKPMIIGTQYDLSLKNIQVLNYIESDHMPSFYCPVNGLEILSGNQFRKLQNDASNLPDNQTHFLSIHLGIIEKMLKNSEFLCNEEYCGPKRTNSLSKDRVSKLMNLLRQTFSPNCPDALHICIHTGRGHLNKEMEESLKEYPLISFSTLESLFNNSKFLLSQLFYNTLSVGRKEIN